MSPYEYAKINSQSFELLKEMFKKKNVMVIVFKWG